VNVTELKYEAFYLELVQCSKSLRTGRIKSQNFTMHFIFDVSKLKILRALKMVRCINVLCKFLPRD